MEKYIYLVKNYPLLSAFCQFAILGTFGELLAICINKKKLVFSWSLSKLIMKMLAWGILGIVIKYGFKGMKGFVSALIIAGYIPDMSGIVHSFYISFFTNLFFGPQMMLFHRIEDNLIDGNIRPSKWDFSGMMKSIKTLAWFWVPAHTITFILPVDFQIGLAAIWGVVLGIILGGGKK
ncbi:MAG: hypothetical protein C0601_02880 [Candidatus Muiribacterium halophilum]|uniref:Mpv17/PMP22 family protein n=1 Tax=Muiribacterium halophilum TaxID=2053465 RepID=A0A2N5ZKC3_MUIH1|nr:MAG: hypothetical protein C0601_02880 [Candidatus Muirbacterium halophilum]